MAELTYIRVGDYYIPDLALGDQTDKPIGLGYLITWY